MIQVKTKYIIIGAILAILSVFISGWVLGHRKAVSVADRLLIVKNREIRHYITVIEKDSVLVAQKEQIILSQRQAIKAGEIEREELRRLNIKKANEVTRLRLKIDTLLTNVDNNATVIVLYDTITKTPRNAVLLPFITTKNDQWLTLKDSTDINGDTFVSLGMDVPIDIWSVIEKKTKKPIFILTTKNTYIKTLSINSIKMDTPKPKRWGIGLQLGYGLILSDPIEPSLYIGVGISRNLFRF